MPHACRIGIPILVRYPSDSALGTADPPQGMARKLDTSRPSSSPSTPIQIVGTPAAMVTRSVSISSANGLGAKFGPGLTSLAPAATAAWERPQALAWNMGTTGMITSLSHTPAESTSIAANVWR